MQDKFSLVCTYKVLVSTRKLRSCKTPHINLCRKPSISPCGTSTFYVRRNVLQNTLHIVLDKEVCQVHMKFQLLLTSTGNKNIYQQRGIWLGSFFLKNKNSCFIYTSILNKQIKKGKINETWASLVAHWLRICLLMQETRVRALVWEDPTCHGAAGPVSHSC